MTKQQILEFYIKWAVDNELRMDAIEQKDSREFQELSIENEMITVFVERLTDMTEVLNEL